MGKSYPLTQELLDDQTTWDERRYLREFPDKDPLAVTILAVFLVSLVGLVVFLGWLLAHAGEPSPTEAGYLRVAATFGAVLLVLVVVELIVRQVRQRRSDREEL